MLLMPWLPPHDVAVNLPSHHPIFLPLPSPPLLQSLPSSLLSPPSLATSSCIVVELDGLDTNNGGGCGVMSERRLQRPT
eukprot:scaffold43575_cov41-Cyclotella_meneghiniana.AAC.6